MTIRSLFDPGKDIFREIETVISYGVSQEARLKAEITEYVVTERIEEQLERLLGRMQLAMESGAGNEIGVWVSGFYGSGKSSFTKYLGLAFDDQCKIDGTPFLRYLQDRLHKPQTKALLGAVAQRFPAAVVMVDLASDMVTGATQMEVSTVLYLKVLQWAGYSRNLKIATFEMMVERDGRWAELDQEAARAHSGATWAGLHNNPLVAETLVPKVAHSMYPEIFSDPAALPLKTGDYFQFESERVREMIELVRRKSGKQNVLFVLDEVGQYIGSRDNLILNLDGLAKNLKRLGEGRAWIISTAQQTLTEDDPRAALNSDKLYKLKDRFPIQIDLESSDIREICYRRLLGKSAAGEAELGALFDAHGQALRHNTKLQDAKFYDSDFKREDFIHLYPFLPAHFDILLHLLGALAKSTGGFGLRSAIKVVQDILRGNGGTGGMAGEPVGALASTVRLFDDLKKEIQRAFPSIYDAARRVEMRYPDSPLHQEVGKTVAILQILGNLPVTVQNVASLMHPSVTAPSRLEEVRAAVEQMVGDNLVPLGEKDGCLVFLSEKLRDIEQERKNIALRSIDVRRILNEGLRASLDPLPKAVLDGTLTVTAGLKVQSGSGTISLAGDQHPVQIVMELVSPAEDEAARNRALDESRRQEHSSTIFLMGRTNPELEDLANEIYRCQRIAELHRNEPDQEVRDYCNSQIERGARLAVQLQSRTKQMLQAGSFVFRGHATAVTALDADLQEAARKLLDDVASQVFHRYAEASVRTATDVAEQILKAGNPAYLKSDQDPLGLIQTTAGRVNFKTDHKAIVSLRDYLQKRGSEDGGKLLSYFNEPPFGWSRDTTRYILAVMLIAGEIKLRISGHEVTSAGPRAIEALKNNNSFKNVTVSPRLERPSTDVLVRAAERLGILAGETTIPLEQEISRAANQCFKRLQTEYGALPERLDSLGLAGGERARAMIVALGDILLTDASDAPQRLGAESSALYDDLIWALEVKQALDAGMADTIRDLQAYRSEILGLPESGAPGALRRAVKDDLEAFESLRRREDFYHYSADFNSQLTCLQSCVRNTVIEMAGQQKKRLQDGMEELQRLPEWKDLTQEECSNAVSELESLKLPEGEGLADLKQMLARSFDFNSRLEELRDRIEQTGKMRLNQRRQSEESKKKGKPAPLQRSVTLPDKVTTVADLDALIQQLNGLRAEIEAGTAIEVLLMIDGAHIRTSEMGE